MKILSYLKVLLVVHEGVSPISHMRALAVTVPCTYYGRTLEIALFIHYMDIKGGNKKACLMLIM